MKRVLSFVISGTFVASCASAPSQPKQARENTVIAPATAAPAPAPQPAPVVAPVAPPDPWAGRTDLLAPPAMVLDTKVDLGTVERYKLPNGAQVILVPRKSAPVINVIVGFRSGRLSEPVERAGLANFTAAMLRKGTAKRTADQISRTLDARGVNVGAGASTDLMSVRCSGRASELALCLDNTADLVLRPSFPDKELAEVRTQMLAGIAARRDAPSGVADMHWRNQLFGEDDPRGRSPSPMSLSAIDRETMKRFYDANFDPSLAVIAVSGDFDTAATRKRIAALFGSWKSKSSSTPKTPAMPVPIGLSLRVVDKPEATQAAIVLAGPAIDSRSPDYPAVTLMNYIFGGGGFSSRLMQTVRSQGGKTYGVRSRFDVMRTGGVFVIATSTRTEEVGATLQLIDGELAKIRKGGVTQEELDKAKANLIGGYGLGLETAADVSDALLSAELDGQGPAFVTEWPARLQRVTTDDVQRVAEKYLRPAVLTVAGNRMGFVAQLGKIPWLDKIPTETLSFTEPVSARERAALEHGPATHAPPATIPATVDVPALKLLEAAYQHAGGAKLEKVKKLVLSGKGQMTVNGKSIAVQAVETYTPPDGLRMEMTIGAQTMVQVLERDRGYLESGKRHQDLPAEMLTEMRRAYWRDPHFVLANVRRGGTTLAMGAPEKLDGRELQMVIATSGAGDVVKLLVDAKTSELVEIRYTEEGKPGTDRMTEYRVVEGTGIRAPFHVVRHGAGGDLLDITYEKIAIE